MPHDDPFAGKTVEADWAFFLDTSGTYTPVLTATTTNPNIGADGSISAAWHRNGHLIGFWVRVNFSGAGVSPGSGTFEISLPFDADASIMPTSAIIGGGVLFDSNNAAIRQPVTIGLSGVAVARMRPTGGTFVTDASPFTWAAGDNFLLDGSYLADPADLPT